MRFWYLFLYVFFIVLIYSFVGIFESFVGFRDVYILELEILSVVG